MRRKVERTPIISYSSSYLERILVPAISCLSSYLKRILAPAISSSYLKRILAPVIYCSFLKRILAPVNYCSCLKRILVLLSLAPASTCNAYLLLQSPAPAISCSYLKRILDDGRLVRMRFNGTSNFANKCNREGVSQLSSKPEKHAWTFHFCRDRLLGNPNLLN